MTQTLATWANNITAEFEKNILSAVGEFSEYLEDATYDDPDASGRMPWDLDFHYLFDNILKGVWQQMYGNTTDTTGNDDPRANLQREYFKAVHVKARADKALADYIHNRPELHYDNPRTFDHDAAADDAGYTSRKRRAEMAEKRMDALKALFNAFLDLYHSLYEDVWTYKPYKVTEEALPRTQTKAQQMVAERIRAMKNRNTAAA
jgi:hypothetical protein